MEQFVNKEVPQDRRAEPGRIWQCGACGKYAEDHFGIVGWHSHGYDESCMLNASQVDITQEFLNAHPSFRSVWGV